ncbi:terminase TerL endonuclease subunit [Porphyromonas cangingivalis]|uniref:Phage terminase-like protein, large subunit, contains N-terminal HTH domain n=1 Tax=Porphyromonas cangingivalis TaxID=36874 RepID=A0A1T4KJT6_PORCN|nr:terminase TerL endonuclease subunit [Porphyromonas cangingivalis]SJZ42645.1 Phage terminase-like protein, large subunit, contains N-terminal HTH domain [Porphyromonas cangingivalis]VEJ02607.1 Phage terminase-like protein, large subunit [Porphyromonas cangingivalis]
MTEEDKDKLKQAKVDITQELSDVELSAYKLEQVDQRIDSYIREVAGNPDGHNLFEQLSVMRFLRMYDKYGVNVTEVQRFFTLYESLYFPGTRGERTYRLTPVQTFQFASIYAFWHEGKRVVREALLYVPRKFSKTTSSASLAIDDLLYGDANAESYTGANSHDQAKKCFDVIRGCMRRLDPKGRRYVVNEQTIKSRRKDRSAFAQCLTANARTKDGLNASTVILDEFSQARNSELLTVLTTSMGVRENPLTVIITTASDVFDGPFYEMLQGYKSILLGEYEDDSVFVHIFEPDLDDPEDSEDTWRKVHPHLGVTVSMDFYRQEYRKALRNGGDAMLAFRTKLLNVYSENQQKSWISSTLARHISRHINVSSIKGRPDAMVAIDLSESDDFSAVTMAMYNTVGKSFSFHTAYFFPEGALSDHPNESLYRLWAEKGYLKLTKGEVIDYSEIVKYVLYLNQYIRILGIGYDPWKSQEVVNMLAASGAANVLKGVKQTYGNFTAPVESFEHGAKTGKIIIDDNPINAYCFGNAIIDEDKLENKKPIKRKQTAKIDGVITKLMCLRLFIDYER